MQLRERSSNWTNAGLSVLCFCWPYNMSVYVEFTNFEWFACWISPPAVNEYCQLDTSTIVGSVKWFAKAIFSNCNIWKNHNSTHRKQLKINSDRAFLGMFVGIDFIHYRWKKCPIGWQGQFENKDGESFIIQAITNQFLWRWQCIQLTSTGVTLYKAYMNLKMKRQNFAKVQEATRKHF
jgi:hypothetical protein